jgi:hypothetical protein
MTDTTHEEEIIDQDNSPKSEWLIRFKEKIRQEAEANHLEDYQEDIDE